MDNELFLLQVRVDALEELQDNEVKLIANFAKSQTKAFIMIRKALMILITRLDRLEGKPFSEQDLVDIDFEAITAFLDIEEDE